MKLLRKKNIPGKASLNGVDNSDVFVKVGN